PSTPRSSLSPYTTLFRSDNVCDDRFAGVGGGSFAGRIASRKRSAIASSRGIVGEIGNGVAHLIGAGRQIREYVGSVRFGRDRQRSEEHTSELQSRENLVC